MNQDCFYDESFIQQDENDDGVNRNEKENIEIDEKKDEICIHKNIKIDNGLEFCTDCGLGLSRDISLESEIHFYHSSDTRSQSDPSRVYFRSNVEKNIYKDLEKYSLPQDIKERINREYLELVGDEIYRGACRSGLIFATAFDIYKKLGSPKNKDELNTMFKIDSKDITRGLKMYKMKKANKGVKNLQKSIKPIDYIPLIMERFNANKSNIEKVKLLSTKIINKSSELNSAKPLSVASGLVYYYCRSLGKDINVKDFGSIIKLNSSTILKTAKLISGILKTTDSIKL